MYPSWFLLDWSVASNSWQISTNEERMLLSLCWNMKHNRCSISGYSTIWLGEIVTASRRLGDSGGNSSSQRGAQDCPFTVMQSNCCAYGLIEEPWNQNKGCDRVGEGEKSGEQKMCYRRDCDSVHIGDREVCSEARAEERIYWAQSRSWDQLLVSLTISLLGCAVCVSSCPFPTLSSVQRYRDTHVPFNQITPTRWISHAGYTLLNFSELTRQAGQTRFGNLTGINHVDVWLNQTW